MVRGSPYDYGGGGEFPPPKILGESLPGKIFHFSPADFLFRKKISFSPSRFSLEKKIFPPLGQKQTKALVRGALSKVEPQYGPLLSA